MNLKEKYYDRKGFKRETSLESMKNNPTIISGDIVKVAETGYFYNIKDTPTPISLSNGLFAEVKQTTFLQIVTNCINNLTNLTNSFNVHVETMATPAQNGHMSIADKNEVGKIKDKFNKTGETELNLNGYTIRVIP